MGSFNPRPPRRAGATSFGATSSKFSIVSILARPEGRALLYSLSHILLAYLVSILARPEGRALLTTRLY